MGAGLVGECLPHVKPRQLAVVPVARRAYYFECDQRQGRIRSAGSVDSVIGGKASLFYLHFSQNG